MSIDINGKIYLNIEIPNSNFVLKPESFIDFKVISEIDNLLPVCEFTIKKTSYDLLEQLVKAQSTFIVSFADKQENVEEDLEFSITNFSVAQSETTGEVNYTLYGVLKSEDYDKECRIRSWHDKNSYEVIRELENKDLTIDVDSLYESTDNQNWVQHNCSDKEFITRTLKYAYIEEGDVPLCGINLRKQIKIVSMKKQFKDAADNQDSLVKFSNTDEGMYRFRSYRVDTQRGLFQKAFMDGREQPVIDMHVKGKQGQTNVIWSAILNMFAIKTDENKEYVPTGTYGSGNDYPILVNAGNCHQNYYKAYINNTRAKALLTSLNIVLDIDQSYFKDEDLSILDIVEFRPVSADQKPIKELTGNYMVTKKVIHFENRSSGTQLTLSRIGV